MGARVLARAETPVRRRRAAASRSRLGRLRDAAYVAVATASIRFAGPIFVIGPNLWVLFIDPRAIPVVAVVGVLVVGVLVVRHAIHGHRRRRATPTSG